MGTTGDLVIIVIYMLAILGVGYYASRKVKSSEDYTIAIFVSGIFVPTMAAIYWKKATKAGALISSIVASIAVVVLYGLKLSNMLPSAIEPIFISILISLVLMVGISLMTYNPETATPRLKDLEDRPHDKGN